MGQGSPYVPRLKMSAFWNDCKAVKNPPVLYVIHAGVVDDTGDACLGFYDLHSFGINHEA